MIDVDDVHAGVEAFVLGALDERERSLFERHLAGCSACHREIASYVPLIGALRDMPFPAAPPVRLPSGQRSSFAPRKLSRFPVALYPVAAVIALTIGGAAGALVQRNASSDIMAVGAMDMTSVAQIALRGSGVAGRAIVGAARRRTAFVATGLPQPGPMRDYQVWVKHGRTSSPGVLHRSTEGFEVLIVPGDMLQGAQTVTITLEPSGGSREMTGTPLLSGTARDV